MNVRLHRAVPLFALWLCMCGAPQQTQAPAQTPTPTQTETQTATPTPAPTTAPPKSESTPKTVVEDFGRRMKQVSTTAPADVAARSIRENYRGLVREDVLEAWTAAPGNAPGRQVSSPWPDRIEVDSTDASNGEATVRGTLVEATSTGDARRVPVEVRLAKSGDAWLITSYRAEEIEKAEDATDPSSVIRDYYAAINARAFERAFAAWGETGPPGQNYRTFVAGFADTASVSVTIGTPSRIEGAAGSRFITIPVKITATTKDGRTQHFEGTYTLRRSVVDGATAAQRRWHLFKGEIRSV